MMEIQEQGLHELKGYEVHIGEETDSLHMRPDDVISVYADGDELQAVIEAFSSIQFSGNSCITICSIPNTGESYQMWFGDIAKSIAYWAKHYIAKQ